MSATQTKPRLLTPAEIAVIVKAMRTQMAWSQETLAELSRLTVRTVQRLEAGQPASLDTRRAVAAAFGWDLDFFDVPRTIPTEEDLAAQKAAFDREHLILDAVQADGRGILTRLHDIPGFKAIVPCSLVEMSRDGQDAFALIVDYIHDCLDIIGEVPRSDVLRYGDELTEMSAHLADAGYRLHVATRDVKIGNPAWTDQRPMPITILYVVAAPDALVVRHIAVKRKIAM
jgi:transcriptional regulator with XRE-family HTH domain